MDTQRKKALYESIMKRVAKTVKQVLNEEFNEEQNEVQRDLMINMNDFSRILYNKNLDDLTDYNFGNNAETVDEANANVISEMHNFVNNINSNVKLRTKLAENNIHVTIIDKNLKVCYIRISGIITEDDFKKYLGYFREFPFPENAYKSELQCFIPEWFLRDFAI